MNTLYMHLLITGTPGIDFSDHFTPDINFSPIIFILGKTPVERRTAYILYSFENRIVFFFNIFHNAISSTIFICWTFLYFDPPTLLRPKIYSKVFNLNFTSTKTVLLESRILTNNKSRFDKRSK